MVQTIRDAWNNITGFFINDETGLYGIAAVVLAVLSVFIFRAINHSSISKKIDENRVYEEYNLRKKEKKKADFYLSVYRGISKLPILRKIIGAIERSYLRICPYDDSYLMRLVAETLTGTFVVITAGVLVVLSFNLWLERVFSLYSVCCAVLVAYVFGIEVSQYYIKKKDTEVGKETVHFFSKVKHCYVACGSIPQAIMEASEDMGYEIRRHAMQIYDIMVSSDRRMKVREYICNPETNLSMRSFVGQCYEVSERGDSICMETGGSVFSRNMEFLRMELLRRMLQKQKKEWKMSGFVFVTCVPVFFMVPLRIWGLDFEPQLESFYRGAGVIVTLLAMVITYLVYSNINKVKDITVSVTSGNHYLEQQVKHGFLRNLNRTIEKMDGPLLRKVRELIDTSGIDVMSSAFVVKMAGYFLVAMLGTCIIFETIHISKQNELLTKVTNLDNIVYSATVKQKDVISGHILDMTKEYLEVPDVTIEQLQYDFKQRMYFPNKEAVERICQEVLDRIDAYKNEYFMWYELVLSIAVGVAGALIPYFSLKYQKGLIENGIEDEIRQFQSTIILQRSFEDITIPQILEEMENVAVYFKKSIRKCINEYSSGSKQALLHLKEEHEEHADFCELIDGFIAVEQVGISVAFAELHNNQRMQEEMRELTEEIMLTKKSDATEILSVIPAIVVLGGYFIGPFLISVIGSTIEMFEMMENVRF